MTGKPFDQKSKAPTAKAEPTPKPKSNVTHGTAGTETVTPTIARAPEDPQDTAEKQAKPVKAKAEAPSKLETAEGEKTKDHAKKHQILMVFRGGERDGVTGMVDADTESIVEILGHNPHEERYNICDEQEGDARVFRFTTGDGEALSTGVMAGIEVGTTLQANLDALEAEVKRSGNEKKRTTA